MVPSLSAGPPFAQRCLLASSQPRCAPVAAPVRAAIPGNLLPGEALCAGAGLLGAGWLVSKGRGRRALRRLRSQGVTRAPSLRGLRAAVVARAGAVADVAVVDETLLAALEELRQCGFFSLFRLNLFAPCQHLCEPEEVCDMRCAVEPVEDVSDWLRDRDEEDFKYVLDGWTRWDSPTEQAEYYSLLQYPESDTGYDGRTIWGFIHDSICYGSSEGSLESAFNAGVSAFHTSVSASIIADLQSSGDEEGAKEQIERRIRRSAEEDVRKAHSLVLSAVHKIMDVLRNYDYGDETSDILPLLEQVAAAPPATSEQLVLKDLPELRLRLRELCLVMDCVQCNACRMHGKISAVGLAAAFRVHCSEDVATGKEALTRVEVGCLVVLLSKLSTTLQRLAEWRS